MTIVSVELDIVQLMNNMMLTVTTVVQLPATFTVWAASPEARFSNGKFVWYVHLKKNI